MYFFAAKDDTIFFLVPYHWLKVETVKKVLKKIIFFKEIFKLNFFKNVKTILYKKN